MPKNIQDQVREFHDASNIVPDPTEPTLPTLPVLQLRLRLIGEEFCELLEACGVSNIAVAGLQDQLELYIRGLKGTDEVDLVECADALGDLDYVVEGTRQAFGIDGVPIAEEIHRSNMAKVNPQTGRMERNAIGKVVKPASWTPPDIAGVMGRQILRKTP